MIASRVASGNLGDDAEAAISFVTIEILNSWVNFIRAYYLSCAFSAVSVTGTRITAASRMTENQAIGCAVHRWKPHAQPKADGSWNRRDEPNWHDPNIFIPICHTVAFSNVSDIEAAFSTGERTFDDLPVFRNYFAHRNWRTELAARNRAPLYGIPSSMRPSQILLARPLGRPQPLIFDWIDHLSFTGEFLCA